MTDSISSEMRRRLIDEGYRLHMAIVEWGRKHGVWAYRVIPPNGSAYFEIYNPETKKCSHDFPAKIKKAIATHAAALAEYEAWSRSWDRATPREQVLSRGVKTDDPSRDNQHNCDCNGEMRSTSPINHGADVALAGDGSQTDSADDGRANRRGVDFRT